MTAELKKPEDRVVNELEPVLEGLLTHEGLELVGASYRRESTGWVLRILIDKEEGGVTIDDCSSVSHQLSDILDVKDLIPYPYKLEVSSPGVNRPLKKISDFAKHAGETVKLTTSAPVGNSNRKHFEGTLVGYQQDTVIVDQDGSRIAIPYEMILKANIEYDFSKKAGHR